MIINAKCNITHIITSRIEGSSSSNHIFQQAEDTVKCIKHLAELKELIDEGDVVYLLARIEQQQ